MRQLLTVAFLALTLAASEAAATKVAVFSVDGDRDTEDLCIAAISQHPGIQLVDRRSLNQILGEQVVTAAFASTAKAAQLGKLSGIDLLLSIRREMKGEHNLNLEVLDCATGRILSHGSATGESLPRETQRLLKQAEVSASPHGKAIKVAVEDFSEGGKAINYKLAAAIRGALTDEGFDVLDRAVIQHAAAEHEVERAGLSTGNLTSLPGVDYLLTGTVENQTLNLKLLDASKGRLVTGSSFPMATAINDTVHLLKAQAKGMKPNPVSILEPRVQIEALVPLYEGITLFRDGDIYGALLSFWKAQSLDDKFMEAYEWEARCFDALKLPRLGEAIRRFARECLVGLGVSVPSINIPSDGITFLGIQSETSTPLLEMKAVEKLVKAAPGQIVLPDELSIFRNEYDAVIGGSDKAWLTAPGFLTRWSLRASPSQADGSKLEWTLFDTLRGGIVGTATTEADKPEAWEIPLRNLLMEKDSPTPQKADAAPALTTNSPAKMNLSQVSLNPDDKENLVILDMLLNDPKNPALRNKLFKREGDNGQLGFLNFALRDQVIESLPPDDSYRAWLELDRIASFLPNDLSGIQFSGKEIDPISALKDFVEGHPHDAAIARMMTAPNITPLQASAFPSLAVALVMLEKNNSCMLSPEHTTEAITIRLQCATAIDSVGLKLAGAHQMPRSAETRAVNFGLGLLKFRQRKQLLECKKQNMSTFFPIKIKESGGRLIDWKECAKSTNYIFYPEKFRGMMLTSETLEFIQERWIKGQNAQKIFLEQNNNHPLIDCARLLGPEVSWLGSKAALNSMLLHVGGDPSIKSSLLSSLLLTLMDSSVFVMALDQKKETHRILEAIYTDFIEFLDRFVFPYANKEIEYFKNQYQYDGFDAQSSVEHHKAVFVRKECMLLLQRSLELVTSKIQHQLSSMLTDPIIKEQVERGKRILLRSRKHSEKEKQEFSDSVSQILESNKRSICELFLLPWPAVSFDINLIRHRFRLHLQGGLRDEMKKVISLKEAPLDTIGVDLDKADSFKPHIPAIEDEKLLAVSGSGKMNLEAIFSAKSPEIIHAKLLDLEKSVAADPRIPEKLISLAKETKAELPLLKLILDYFETLKLGNMSLIHSARKAFEAAIFPEGDFGS